MTKSKDPARKYYKLTGSLSDDLHHWWDSNYRAYTQAIGVLCEEFGTDQMIADSLAVYGFKDVGKEIPGTKPSADHPGYWVPKRNTKAGKALIQRLRIQRPDPNDFYRKALGATEWMTLGHLHYPDFFRNEGSWIVSVPDFAEVPEHPELVPVVKRSIYVEEIHVCGAQLK